MGKSRGEGPKGVVVAGETPEEGNRCMEWVVAAKWYSLNMKQCGTGAGQKTMPREVWEEAKGESGI